MWGLSSSDSHFPLIYYESTSRTFPASHVIDGHPLCSKMHGHTYRVEVSIETDQMLLADWIKQNSDLNERVSNLMAELSGRHLNDMMPGAYTTPIGIAAWFAERLLVHVPLYEVTIWQDGERATVRHE